MADVNDEVELFKSQLRAYAIGSSSVRFYPILTFDGRCVVFVVRLSLVVAAGGLLMLVV